MLAQLGNIIFETQFAPESLSHTDATTYAEHAKVSGKPRLQPVANNLEEFSMSMKLRAEFCNVAASALTLKSAKDGFAVMPFISGNGQYYGDFVITNIEKAFNQVLDDGTLIEATLQVSLKEFVSPDKLQQQQVAARKKAFALNRSPVNTGQRPSATPAQIADRKASIVMAESKSVDSAVLNYETNTSQQAFISADIRHSLANITAATADYQAKVDALDALQTGLIGDYNTISLSVTQVNNAVAAFTFPITSVADLKVYNNVLQNASSNLKKNNTTLSVNVICRRL